MAAKELRLKGTVHDVGYRLFLLSEAGDDMDFFEWKAVKELSDELEAERKVL